MIEAVATESVEVPTEGGKLLVDRWVFRDFLACMMECANAQGATIAQQLQHLLFLNPALVDTRMMHKTLTGTQDGGSNMTAFIAAVQGTVGCGDLLPGGPEAHKPILNPCQAHLVNATAKSINPGKAFSRWKIADFLKLGFPEPKYDPGHILHSFLGGTTVLKKSAPTWRAYVRLCKEAGLRPVVLRNPAPTRWLSNVAYLVLLLKYRRPYTLLWQDDAVAAQHRKKHYVKPEIWELAAAMLEELLPLYRLIHRVQRAHNSYLLSECLFDIGQTIALYLRRLEERKISPVKDDVGCLRVHLLNNIVDSMKENWPCFFKYTAPLEHWMFSLILDPRYCNLQVVVDIHFPLGCNSASPDYETKLESMKALCKQYRYKLWEKAASLVPTTPVSEQLKVRPMASLADDYADAMPAAPAVSSQTIIAREVENFRLLASLTCQQPEFAGAASPVFFWPRNRNQCPNLYRVAVLYGTVKTTQVKAEGVFSAGGIITGDRRARTGIQRVDDILYIWANHPDKEIARALLKEPSASAALRKQKIELPDLATVSNPITFSAADDDDILLAEAENDLLADVPVADNGLAKDDLLLPTVFEVCTMELKEGDVVLQQDDLLGDDLLQMLDDFIDSDQLTSRSATK